MQQLSGMKAISIQQHLSYKTGEAALYWSCQGLKWTFLYQEKCL